MQPMRTLNGLFGELRRRRVFGMTAIYIASAWVLVEATSVALPALDHIARMEEFRSWIVVQDIYNLCIRENF